MISDQEIVEKCIQEGNEHFEELIKRHSNYIYGFMMRLTGCLLYTSPSPRDLSTSRMPSSA